MMNRREFVDYSQTRADDDDEHPLTADETAELLAELVGNSPGRQLEGDELRKAHQAVLDLFYGQCLLYMRGKRQIEFGWDSEAQDLILVDRAEAARNDGPSWIDAIKPS